MNIAVICGSLGVRQRTFALRARWRCAYPSVTVVARTVVRLAPLWRWCAYPSTATGARCGAGLLRWPARVRLRAWALLHVHAKNSGRLAPRRAGQVVLMLSGSRRLLSVPFAAAQLFGYTFHLGSHYFIIGGARVRQKPFRPGYE